MCWNGKCCLCMKVETGTMIFAVINAVVAALITLAAVILMIVFNVAFQSSQDNIINALLTIIGYGSATTIAGALGNIILGVLTLFIVVHFTFSVLLADGVFKKEPPKMIAYFIYGVFVNVCWYIITIIFWSVTGSFENVVHILIIQLLYTAILVMIRMTYLKISNGVTYGYGYAQRPDNQYQSLVGMNPPA